MKKITYTLLCVAAICTMISCGSSKQARTDKKLVNGTWILNSVTSEGIKGKIKAKILEEAAFACFEGSIWKFNQNSSLGSYEIVQNSGECVAKTQDIRWSIIDQKGMPQRLQYKKVDSKYYKDIDPDKAGFRFTIITLDNTTMQLKSEISFEGKPAFFVYNYTKK